MNTLLARTRPEFYAKMIATLREGGIAEREIQGHIEAEIKEAKALLNGDCPKCGAPIARHIDYLNQQGPSEVPGMWVQYRCSAKGNGCDYFADLKEGEESS